MSEIFKSDFFNVTLSDSPASKGHLTVSSEKSLSKSSTLESNVFFTAASTCSSAIFQLLGAHGTNIIIQDKENSLFADVIARMPNDGLDFLWQPSRADPNELDSVAKSIKDEIDILVWKKDNPGASSDKKTPPLESEVIKNDSSDSKDAKVNYLIKKLTRTP